MEKGSRSSDKKIGKGISLGLFLLVLLLTASAILVYSLGFQTGPVINNGVTPVYTTDNLVCAWVNSSDTTQVNVSWYEDGIFSVNEAVSTNSSTIFASSTTKHENWTCEVNLWNGTAALSQNVSAVIMNSAQAKPEVYNATSQISSNYTLLEDTVYTFTMNSSDPDGDTLVYRATTNNLCTVTDENAGTIVCSPTHLVITGTSNPAAESNLSKMVTVWADDNTELVSVGSNQTFVLVPVNDQAYFTQNLTNRSITASTAWSVSVTGIDEELNYPLNFTLWSDLNDAFPGLLVINNTSSTTANISFSTTTNNNNVGNWTVVVNVSDANGTGSRNFSRMTFGLQINTTFYPPNFTTNFTALSLQNWTQGGSMDVLLAANSSNAGDNLSFNITTPTTVSLRCNLSLLANPIFPWNITTENSNNTNASGRINVTLLTNDYVACRYVDLIVSSPYGGTTRISNYLLNVTNTNDPPVLHEIGADGNMSDQSVSLYSMFVYRVNATDIDSITYDVNRTANLTYYSNDSLFPINRTTGIINVNPGNDSYLGLWSINITVSDGYINDSRVLILEVLNNSAPVLNLASNNIIFNQNDVVTINLSATEPDGDILNLTFSSLTIADPERPFNDTIYSGKLVNLSNDYSGGVNLEEWVLNMSASTARERNTLVGGHRLNITVTDGVGSFLEDISTGILNFTILNENDAPFFDRDQDNITDTVNFTDVVVNIPYSILINATDYDLYVGSWANESLSFNYSLPSADLQNISFVKVEGSSNSAELNFTSSAEGPQSINITVSDVSGVNYSQFVTFTVLPNSSVPVFLSIKPYFNSTLGYTVMEYTNASAYGSNTNTINVSENTTVLFDALLINDTLIANNSLTLSWYVDGVLNETLTNITPGINTNISKYFNFFSNGTRNITVLATDVRYSRSTWTWLVNVSNLNRAPVYCPGSLTNLTVNGTLTVSSYVGYSGGKQRFYDPDDDSQNTGEGAALNCSNYNLENMTLNYSVIKVVACSIATFSFSHEDMTVIPSLTGLCRIQINATDVQSASVVSSDIVDVTIIGSNPSGGNENPSRSSGGSTTVTQVVTVPVDQDVDKPVPIKIITPGIVNTYANKTISIPIIIKNTWKTDIRGVELSGIALNATMAHEGNVSLKFSQQYFGLLPMGAEAQAMLEISNYRRDGPFEITIYAKVKDPEFVDSTNILISSLEQTSRGDAITSKVTFAKDMLSDNPACRELTELLDRAEGELVIGNLDEASKLVDGAINGCKYLMEHEEARRESPSVLQKAFDMSREYALEIMIVSAIILLLTLVFYAILALRRKLTEK